jgi:hypothetical protein
MTVSLNMPFKSTIRFFEGQVKHLGEAACAAVRTGAYNGNVHRQRNHFEGKAV